MVELLVVVLVAVAYALGEPRTSGTGCGFDCPSCGPAHGRRERTGNPSGNDWRPSD